MSHIDLLEKLWMQYSNYTPSASRIHELLNERGDQVVNDHIAFRTFNHPSTNIDRLSRLFMQNGYEIKGEYFFEQKRLHAKHFEHVTDKLAPKIFISELLLEQFSQNLQNIVCDIVEKIPQNTLGSDDLILSGKTWGSISYETYSILREESEYCSWLYLNGFCPNHFTVFINHLKSFNGIVMLNNFLREHGFKLNTSGGEIKGSVDQFLLQSSIIADKQKFEFTDGVFEVPTCYYEFAQRFNDQEGNLFQGFIAKSADKIFESTDLVLR